jgi:hypothetical protein
MKRILLVFAVTAAVLLLVFSAAEQYAERSAIPRYCADQTGVIERVGIILTKGEPVGQASKRPFIVAAKLIFLVPQRDDEDTAAYLERLRVYLFQTCANG